MSKESSLRWAREHPEENRAKAREWNKDHPYGTFSEEQKAKKRESTKRWKAANPEKYKAQQARRYKRHRNGRRMPGGLCDLCGREETAVARRETGEMRSLQQDHCHATGVLRGLLCLGCNRLLGAAKDRPELLRAAADYIERYRT